MDWVYLALVCVHLLIGLFCGHLAYAARHRAEPWFLAGIVLSGLALVVCFFLANRKRVRPYRRGWRPSEGPEAD